MAHDLDQLAEAITIASNPTPGALHSQALEYLATVQQNAAATWRAALTLFVETGVGGTRKYSPNVRFFALRILEDFLENRSEPLDTESFQLLRQSFISYIQSEYLYGSAEANSSFIRNKFSHTLTLLFLATYLEQWPSFFGDLFALINPPQSTSQSTFNPHVSLLFFHLVLEISGEVADQMIKSARTYSPARHARDGRVRDAVRERDAAAINEAVLTIVADGLERMVRLRKGDIPPNVEKELDLATEVVDWGTRTFTSYVGWIDINLTVTPTTVPLLFNLLSDLSLPIRLAACDALSRIVSKGLKEPFDKLQLIKVLSLGQVLDALETRTRAEHASRGSDIDEGEESYRESLGKLLNVLGVELCKLLEVCPIEARAEATGLLHQVLPVMLRFMADEYDDTCETIFPLLRMVLGTYKKSSFNELDEQERSFLASLVTVILQKSKWDEESIPDDMEDEDKGHFEQLRKDLRTFMDAVFQVNSVMVTDQMSSLSLTTFSAFRNGVPVKWNDAEVAVYMVYIYGEINRTGPKGRAAFCQGADAIAKEKRKGTDYAGLPLTKHGELLYNLIQSGISAYPNNTVVMQYFETVGRYGDFFKVRKDCVVPALQAMVDERGLHSSSSRSRARIFYLFNKFIKEARSEIPLHIASELLERFRDLLVIQVELPQLESPEQDLLTEALKLPADFDKQVYLFETAGMLLSLYFKTPEQQRPLLLSIVKPMLEDLSANLQAVKGPDDVLAIVKVHHIIIALGNVARGFPDFPSPVPEGYIFPPVDIFTEIAKAILVSLETLNSFRPIREATRNAFTRILAPTGPAVTYLIPPLMGSLLVNFDPTELIDFMNFLGQLVHRLQEELFDVLDQLIGPLIAHTNGVLSQPVTGTDDQVMNMDTKRAYLTLLNSVMSSKLNGIFTSERNQTQLEALLSSMQVIAEDFSDITSEKAAFQFLGRCVTIWAQPLGPAMSNGTPSQSQGLPGFERFVYERLVPSAFSVLSSPQFNIKDGQASLVVHEIGNFLQIVSKIRGQEAFDFFATVFLPAQGWTPQAAVEFATKLRDLDGKAFRKYLGDVLRSTRSGP